MLSSRQEASFDLVVVWCERRKLGLRARVSGGEKISIYSVFPVCNPLVVPVLLEILQVQPIRRVDTLYRIASGVDSHLFSFPPSHQFSYPAVDSPESRIKSLSFCSILYEEEEEGGGSFSS